MKYTFPKKERVTLKRDIEELFAGKNNKFLYPFKLLWTYNEADEAIIKALISVPKKNFKRAADRNLLKRRIREAYRLNKDILYDNPLCAGKGFKIAIIYVAKEKMGFSAIQDKIRSLFTSFFQ